MPSAPFLRQVSLGEPVYYSCSSSVQALRIPEESECASFLMRLSVRKVEVLYAQENELPFEVLGDLLLENETGRHVLTERGKLASTR